MSAPGRRITRRRALVDGLRAGAGLTVVGGLAGCASATPSPRAAPSGSTRESTWSDPVGDGQLRVGPGEPLLGRTDLGPSAPALGARFARLAHLTDAHVLDASSPARVTFLNRLGPPFQSTFRPQETLTTQVLAGALDAVRALAPDAVIQGGDLIDNDQGNELGHALTVLGGGLVTPGSGPSGYDGVQLSSDTDPFYYRPAVDAPRHPGLLRAAVTPFSSRGVAVPVLPVFGDHDGLVAGTVVPTALTRSLAIGDRALWNLPSGLRVPAGLAAAAARASPDGPPDPGSVDSLLREALRGPTVRVAPDPRRRELAFAEAVSRLAAAARVTPRSGARLDHVSDLGSRLRVIVLDLVRRGGGSGGEVVAGQRRWLAGQLATAGDRWILVVTHQPLTTSVDGAELLAELDRSPRVIAVCNGHTHRNAITPRRTPAGGYWLISTASLIDYPQQGRALELVETVGGGVLIRTWMLDHVAGGRLGRLGAISRQLAYLDAQGGRPEGFLGAAADRNATLYRGAPPQ